MKTYFYKKGLFTLSLLFIHLIAFAQPSYDECINAIDLGEAPNCAIPGTVYTNVDATASVISNDASINIPACFMGGAPDRDVWFTFLVPADGSVVNFDISITGVGAGSITQPQLAIYRGDCGIENLQEIGCVAAAAGESSVEITMNNLIPGLPIFLRVQDWSASAAENWGDFEVCVKEPDPIFNIAEDDNTALCSGVLYDSGGIDGDYDNNENNTFTICPSIASGCTEFNISATEIEANWDNLTFYAGSTTADPVLLGFTGFSPASSFQTESDCITVEFTSDGSVTNPGFEINWQCSASACTQPIISCANAEPIPTLPYNSGMLTTCGAANAITNGPCNNPLTGEDYVFTYNSPGDECIQIIAAGVDVNTGISIYNDCPDVATDCVGGGVNLTGDTSFVNAAFLEFPGTYYIVIDNPNGCTDFDMTIGTTDCPITLPPALNCEDALSINGCGNTPSLINVGQEAAEDECFIEGVNDGCWVGVGQANYTWFTFQAQADGNFGFLASNGDLAGLEDIDIQVWGPFDEQEIVCELVKTTQPIRSTWASPNGFSTGLVDVHPLTGAVIDDTCEGAAGDGYVSTIPVLTGEWYSVLVNDYSGLIEDSGVAMDFSATSPGVLGPLVDAFSIAPNPLGACPGQPVQIEISGGATYNWLTTDGVSCTDCPNPMITVDTETVLLVEIGTACSFDTLEVPVVLLAVDAGNEIELCLGEPFSLAPSANVEMINWSWSGGPTGSLSCTDCENPVLTINTPGTYEYTVSAFGPTCMETDVVSVTVLDAAVAQFTIADNTSICEGESVALGGVATTDVNYVWTASDASLTSSDANPMVSPSSTTTYYLTATNMVCPVMVMDSVVVEVNLIPTLAQPADATICEGEGYNGTNIQAQNGVVYSWTPTSGVSATNDANPTFTPTSNTTYTLNADNNGCTSTTSFDINVIALTTLMVSEDQTICPGGEAMLEATAGLEGSYSWSPGDSSGSTISVSPSETTIYTIAYSDLSGCTNLTETVTVNVVPGVTIDNITSDPEGDIPQGNPVVLTANTTPAENVEYIWSSGESTMEVTIMPTVVPETSYTVTVSDEFGCSDEATITLTVIGPEYEIPSIFSPNNDGTDDSFGVVINGGTVQVQSFQIFNRWGEMVHEANGADHAWDGSIGGSPAPADVYIYQTTVILPNGEEKQEMGELTLLR